MMMTRFVLTLLVGLVVSLGALVSGVEPVLAKNWNLSAEQKEEIEFQKQTDSNLFKTYTNYSRISIMAYLGFLLI